MTLGEIIRKYREEHDMSQRQFGAACGLSSGYISLIEKGMNPKTGERMQPTLPLLKKIANGMGITLMELLVIADDMPVSMVPGELVVVGDETDEQDNTPTATIKGERMIKFVSLFSQLNEEQQNMLLSMLQGLLK